MQGAGGVGGLLTQIAFAPAFSSVPLADRTVSGQFAYAYNGNGDVTALYHLAEGTKVTSYEYDPFGNVILEILNPEISNPFRFSTKYLDESGSYYYGYRFYDPFVARWVNRDPIGEDGGTNLYVYCLNNTINFIEPLGLQFGIPANTQYLPNYAIVKNYKQSYSKYILKPDKGISEGGKLNEPWAKEGFSLIGAGRFAGPGYSGEFRGRPANVFDFAAKLHDGHYQYNNLSFSFKQLKPNWHESNPMIVSRKAKADYIFSKMNETANLHVGGSIYNAGADIVFYDNIKYFCANDGFVNVITISEWDDKKHLMIPFDELPEDQQPYKTDLPTLPNNVDSKLFYLASNTFAVSRSIVLYFLKDYYENVDYDVDPGWHQWASDYYGLTWSKLQQINNNTDSDYIW